MLSTNYLETAEQCNDEEAKEHALEYSWDPHLKKFEAGRQQDMSIELRKAILQTLELLESNFWVRAYHLPKETVGLCFLLAGLLLCFLVVPVALIPLGIFILVSKKGHHEYCFRRMVRSLEYFCTRERDRLASFNLTVKLEYSYGSPR